jgi:penicillin-binding protein 1A
MLRIRLLTLGALALAFVFGALAAGVVGAIAAYLPNRDRVYTPPEQATRMFARDGQLVASFYRENREFTPLSEIPRGMRNAVLAVEDDRFYQHGGVDVRAMARAALRNIRARALVEGGSTITQQLARTLFLTQTRSFSRKATEIVLAFELERRLTKDEILERYLNEVYFGQGAYGVGMASRIYFGKTVPDLTLDESALLAGLIRAPSLYNPYIHPDRAVDRRAVVLRRMVDLGYLTPRDAAAAQRARLELAREQPAGFVGMRAPYFASTVLQYLIGRYGEDAVYDGGLRVYTTLDLQMQEAAQRAVRQGIEAAGARHVSQGALVALDPATGAIRAMVGGVSFAESKFNRAWQAERQAGSAFKPFIYTAAVAAGWRPWRRILDAPVSYPAGDGTSWRPKNYDRRYRGWVTMRQAIERSINVPAVRTLEAIGPDTVISYARRMGIGSPLRGTLALALGASEVTPLEMASAYGTLAALGIRAQPMAVTLVTDRSGRVLERNEPRRRQAIPETVAYAMVDMLKGVIARGTGRAAALGRPVAGKTGTSDDYRNAWFIGFTPYLATAVWVGNDDNSPMRRVVGGTVPARLWAAFMKDAAASMPPDDWIPPPGMYSLRPPRVAQVSPRPDRPLWWRILTAIFGDQRQDRPRREP